MPTRFMMNKVGYVDDQRFLVGKNVVFEEVRGEEEENKDVVKNSSCFKNVSNISSSSSSSIGQNSDLSENSVDKSGDGEEVQSSYKGPLDAMEALEEVLPIRFLSFPHSEFLMVACSVFDFFQVLFRVSILVNDSFLQTIDLQEGDLKILQGQIQVLCEPSACIFFIILKGHRKARERVHEETQKPALSQPQRQQWRCHLQEGDHIQQDNKLGFGHSHEKLRE